MAVVNLVTNLFADVGSEEKMPGWHILGIELLANRIVDSKMEIADNIVDAFAVLVVGVVDGACF